MTFVAKTAQFDIIEDTPVDISHLLNILTLRRISGSHAERVLIDKYIKPLEPTPDSYGNLFVMIGDEPNIAFTAHTDTVHSDADQPSRQRLRVSKHMATVDTPTKGDCLGADDGTGIWIMLNLIEAKVPGLYCFYRDEETGRQGSEWSLSNHPELYDDIDIMLSFDRFGTQDIITHQMGQRCCSDAFAIALAGMIDDACAPDPGGSFTDSASFVDDIPECTNVCVGYYNQHSGLESQDLTWAAYLVNRLIRADLASLPVERDPSVQEYDDYRGFYNGLFGDSIHGEDDLVDERMTFDEIVECYPEEISYALQTAYGLTKADLIDMIEDIQAGIDLDNLEEM